MQWPGNRISPYQPDSVLGACWQRSHDLIASLRDQFERAGLARDLRTCFVCGSLGRMEAVESSDCDVVVVLSEEARLSPSANDIMGEVFDCIAQTGFARPKSDGIFGSPTSFEQLLDESSAGQVDEDLAVFGKRIQSLLDAQPLIHADEFGVLQQAILNWYAAAPRVTPDTFPLAWLSDDIVRYWRSLCGRTRWLMKDDVVHWRCLNVKLRHSRMLMCAGLLNLLLSTAGSMSGFHDLGRSLRLTPLERILHTISSDQTKRAEQIEVRYGAFLGWMQEGLGSVVETEARFAQAIANGRVLCRLLDGADDPPDRYPLAAVFGEMS